MPTDVQRHDQDCSFADRVVSGKEQRGARHLILDHGHPRQPGTLNAVTDTGVDLDRDDTRSGDHLVVGCRERHAGGRARGGEGHFGRHGAREAAPALADGDVHDQRLLQDAAGAGEREVDR